MPDEPDWQGCVIVAIPEDKDPVWKFSSERVPHMTLVWLGSQALPPEQLAQVQGATEAATARMLQKFRIQALGHITLGDDYADVLLLDAAKPEYLRRLLLQNSTVRAIHDSIKQYPVYTPHVTMGYPDAPARGDVEPWERHLDGVVFDRIAVWDGDYTGKEYRLR